MHHQPAPDSLMLAFYYCRGLNSMWFLAPCPFLELRRSPLTTRPPPQPDSSELSKESVGWAAGPEINGHKESFCLPQLLLGAPNNLPGNLPTFGKQFALLGPPPAVSLLPVQLWELWASPGLHSWLSVGWP